MPGAIYGREDSALLWYHTVVKQTKKQSIIRSEYDPCYFYKIYPDGTRLDMTLYVDDAFVTTDGGPMADADIKMLCDEFGVEEVKENPEYFLGMNLNITSDKEIGVRRIALSVPTYIRKMASKYLTKPLESYPKYETPSAGNLNTLYEAAARREHVCETSMQKAYASEVGALIYALPTCRIDAAHDIAKCARALSFPTLELKEAADRILVYLAQHPDDGLVFDDAHVSEPVLDAYSDSDWAVTHSTTGWVVRFAGMPISYNSSRQKCIAGSSTEAEIIAASHAAFEIKYLRGLMAEMGFVMDAPTVLHVDNSGAVELSRDHRSCQRSRHIERRYLRVRELALLGLVTVKFCPTADNRADMLTKSLPRADFVKHKSALMVDASAPRPVTTANVVTSEQEWRAIIGRMRSLYTPAELTASWQRFLGAASVGDEFA